MKDIEKALSRLVMWVTHDVCIICLGGEVLWAFSSFYFLASVPCTKLLHLDIKLVTVIHLNLWLSAIILA